MIYCIGLSRTGTTSFSDYMKTIGYNIIHYPNETQLFGGLGDGASDIPVVLHYKKLDKMFPNSKFIYTVRDNWIDAVEPYFLRKKGRVNQASSQLEIRRKVYGSVDWDRDLYAQAYQRHDEDVRNYFSDRPNDFLELDIIGGESADRLLEFLGINSRFKSFPKSNSLPKKDWRSHAQ